MSARSVVFVGLMMLVAAARGAAQARLTGADLSGTIVDVSGGVLPGVAVTIINKDTEVTRAVVTDSGGRFVVAALPPGTYRVRSELQGFATTTREIVLTLGQAATLDLTLAVAAAHEEVTVTGDAVLQLGQTTIATVLNQQLIEDLPINGRNFISFSVITPGVSTDRTPQQGASATSGLTFAGQRARSNNIMVDGFDNNDPVVGAVRAVFSQEAIREFQVLTDSYPAEFGRASGGVVNIVTKSGTNTPHGNAFLFFRDTSLNAKNYFDRFDIFGNPVNLEKAPYNQEQWGTTVGGPLRKGKTFFFVSFERTATDDSRLVTIDAGAASLLTNLGFPVEIGNVPLAVRNAESVVKFDHQWTPNHLFVARANYADVAREGIDEYGGSVARSRGTVQYRTDWALAASDTNVLSDRWLNEMRAQFVRDDQTVDALDPTCGGPCTGEDQGGPTLEVTGVASVGRQRFTPQPRLGHIYQAIDTVSYMSSGHAVKVGGEYNRIDVPSSALPLQFGGRYIFSAIPALGIPTALAALQRGVPAAYVQGYGNAALSTTISDVSAFGQDSWTLGRLVVKPGLRYQRQFWSDFAYRVSSVGGSTLTYQMPRGTNNFAPRIALAYDVAGDGRTSIHGGYGMFYENTITSLASIAQIVSGQANGVRTLVLTAPRAASAWNAPGHRLTEDQATALLGGSFPSTVISLDPALKTGHTHQTSVGIDRALPGRLTLNLNAMYVRGFNIPGTIDYNPILPATLGANRRPDDLPCAANLLAPCVNGGLPGTSASVLQYTAFGESWYKGLTVSLAKRPTGRSQFLASYTLSKSEDTSTDYQSNFIVQNNGAGRSVADPDGLPVGFNPDLERGPSTQDQRHRFVLSGVYAAPGHLQLSAVFTAASGRPFTPLAGADLNGDGNGGAFPPDRARTNPADESTSVGRNSGTTAAQYNVELRVSRRFSLGRSASIEALLEVFNALNRVNFIEDTNQSSFAIFGTGAFPTNPLPTYGRYTLTLPPRQVQLATRVAF